MKILIVEDDENSRVLQEVSLVGHGHEVFAAKNGVEALNLIQTWRPEVIISDIMMPNMDGFELCQRIKSQAEFRKIPFVFYTATYVEPKDEAFGLALGASLFLIKPMDPLPFIAQIESVVMKAEIGELYVPDTAPGGEGSFTPRHDSRVRQKLDKKLNELACSERSRVASERAYRRLVESLEVGVVELDADFRERRSNHAWSVLTGGSGKIRGKGSQPLFESSIHPDDRALFRAEAEDVWLARKSKSIQNMRMNLRTSEPDWLRLRLTPLLEGDEVVGLTVLVYDISLEIRSREKVELYREIFNNALDEVVVLDMNQHIIEVNASFARSVGLPAEKLVGQDMETFRVGEFELGQRDAFDAGIEDGSGWQGQVTHRHANGEIHTHWLSLSVIPANDTHDLRIIEILSDITPVRTVH